MATSAVVRAAFTEGSALFIETAARVPSQQWEQQALGEWSVRDLVGHTSRSLLTVEAYLAKPAAGVDVPDPVAYFHAALAAAVDESAVAERGRQAGAALGADPAQAVRAIAERVTPLVDQAPDESVVGTPWGGMRLIDYLPTRIFELSVHTLDLAAALGVASRLPEPAAAVTWELVGQLAHGGDLENDVLRGLTGRVGLPAGYSVLAAP